jgi:hypothetical protein
MEYRLVRPLFDVNGDYKPTGSIVEFAPGMAPKGAVPLGEKEEELPEEELSPEPDTLHALGKKLSPAPKAKPETLSDL